jgi:hypothetical protein
MRFRGTGLIGFILLEEGNPYALGLCFQSSDFRSIELNAHRLRVFEDRVLRRIFGSRGDKVTGSRRKLHNVELRDLYSSPSIIEMIKSRRMRLERHEARMGGREMRLGYWWERDH